MNMKIFFKISLMLFMLAGLSSCDNYEQFEEEVYEKKVYIISRNGNIFNVECALDSTQYIFNASISVSGSRKIDQSVTIELEKDTILLPKYNYSNYETETEKYAKELPEWRYDIPSWTVTLAPGDRDVYGLLPLHIHPEDLEGLSPDSIYFIPLAIKNVSEYKVNAEKFNALVRIYPKNKYAKMLERTTYALKGFYGSSPTDNNPMTANNKLVLPLSANSVRMYVDYQNPGEITPAIINRWSMVVTVNEDKTLSLTPYKSEDGTLEIEQLVPPADDPAFMYTNTYEETPDKYVPGKKDQRFRLYYKYRSREHNSHGWSDWRFVREISSRMELSN